MGNFDQVCTISPKSYTNVSIKNHILSQGVSYHGQDHAQRDNRLKICTPREQRPRLHLSTRLFRFHSLQLTMNITKNC